MPRVSVVIPSYNHGGYIGRSLESVLAQSYRDFEIVIVHSALLNSPSVMSRESTSSPWLSVTVIFTIEPDGRSFIPAAVSLRRIALK